MPKATTDKSLDKLFVKYSAMCAGEKEVLRNLIHGTSAAYDAITAVRDFMYYISHCGAIIRDAQDDDNDMEDLAETYLFMSDGCRQSLDDASGAITEELVLLHHAADTAAERVDSQSRSAVAIKRQGLPMQLTRLSAGIAARISKAAVSPRIVNGAW